MPNWIVQNRTMKTAMGEQKNAAAGNKFKLLFGSNHHHFPWLDCRLCHLSSLHSIYIDTIIMMEFNFVNEY